MLLVVAGAAEEFEVEDTLTLVAVDAVEEVWRVVEGVLLVRFDEAVEATLALTLLLPLTGTLTPAEKCPGMLISQIK